MLINIIFSGIIIGTKAILLFFISMVLTWVNENFGLLIIIIFGIINGFLDIIVIFKYHKLIHKIIFCIIGSVITIFLILFFGKFDFMFKIYQS